eukprot:scpid50410/ scgid31563/ 
MTTCSSSTVTPLLGVRDSQWGIFPVNTANDESNTEAKRVGRPRPSTGILFSKLVSATREILRQLQTTVSVIQIVKAVRGHRRTRIISDRLDTHNTQSVVRSAATGFIEELEMFQDCPARTCLKSSLV